MKTTWFKSTSLGYWPLHPMGWFVTLAALLFMVPVVISVVRTGHSVSDDLYHLFVYGSCTAFWWKWIAQKTSITG